MKPTDGEAFVLGMNCQNIDETIYEQIGIVTDASGVYERMSVYDNLKYFAKILIYMATPKISEEYKRMILAKAPSSGGCEAFDFWVRVTTLDFFLVLSICL